MTQLPTQKLNDVGLLLLRISVAGLMLFHGVAKLSGGTEAIEQMLISRGLPNSLAYGVYVGEILCPLLMILGVFTRTSALVFSFNMVVAIALAHAGDIFKLNEFGGWSIELPMMYLLGGLCIALVGPGRFAIQPEPAREPDVNQEDAATKTASN